MLQYSPKIITDSLVMCLDASQNKSYPVIDLPVKDQLNLWLDAADDTVFSYSSGTTVSQWRDKSGQNNHAPVIGGSPVRSVAINSRKSVSFTATTSFRCLTGNFSSTATHFVVCRATTSSATYQRVYNGGANTDDYIFIGAFANNIATFWGSGPNVWFDTSANSPSTTILNTLRIISAVNNGSTATPYYDGIAMNTKTTTNSAAYIGYELNTYGGGYTGQPLVGEVCEIIVYNKQLTDVERKLVHTYLGQKWGISNTDRSIVDLSNNNNHGLLGNGTVANMPDYDFYNKGALTFNGSSDEVNFGDVIKFTSTQDFTLEVWVNYLPNATSYVPLLSKEDSPGFGYALKVDETYSYQPYLIITGTTNAYRYANVNINDGVWHHIVGVAKASSTTIDMYVDGVLINGIANIPSWAGTATTNALRLGKNYGSAFFKGKLSNSKIYNKALSAAEVLQNYEAQKSKFANTIVQQGLVLNLDAANPYSYAGAGTAWYDVSGNTKDFIIDGSGITYNSGGYFTLADGGITRTATITNSTTCTVVVWIRTTDTQSLIFKGNNDFYYYLAAYNAGQGFYNSNCGTPTYWIDTISVANPNPTYLDGNWHMWEMKNVNFSSWTSYEFNKYSSYTFGNGAVGQIMIYDRNLSSGESLQIYNATKGRFGL
jgi:hypothetical protein